MSYPYPQNKVESTEALYLKPSFYGARTEGNIAPGTIPDGWLPEGTERPKLFDTVVAPNGSGTLTLKNRIVVPPMCQYSSKDGFPTPFHLVHLGQCVLHGFGTVIVEATGVVPEGRISPEDVGIWNEEHVKAHSSLVAGLKSFGGDVKIGLQLAHAGRKASTWSPFYKGKQDTPYIPESEGGWPAQVVSPSAIPYAEGHITPRELTTDEVYKVVDDFVAAADRAYRAGYDFVQLHSAHGYLLSSFNSPVSNKRTDEFGGSFENRTRLLRMIAQRIRGKFPDKGLWVRLNASDGIEHTNEESWNIEESKKLALLLEQEGVDVLELSAGGIVSYNRFDSGGGYMAKWAAAVKAVGLQRMLIASVGRLGRGTEKSPEVTGLLAEYYVKEKHIDLISIGRDALRHPTWVEDAARALTGVRPAMMPEYGYTQSK